MNQILIAKDVAYAAKAGGGTISGYNEVDLLADGAIALFTENGALITTGNIATILNDIKRVYFISGSNDNSGTTPIPSGDKSELIIRLGANYIPKQYTAPVKSIKYLGQNTSGLGSLNLPSPLVAGTEAFIRITDTTSGLRTTGTEVKRYSALVTATSTATTVATEIIAAINADVDSIVVATIVGAGLGIKLVAKNFGTTFQMSADGIYASTDMDEAESGVTAVYTTSDAVAEFAGTGTATQIAALEDAFSPQKGHKNKVYLDSYFWTKPTKVIAGAHYTTYDIHWLGQKAISTGGITTVNHEVIVACPDTSAINATLQGLMDDIFGNTTNIETGS